MTIRLIGRFLDAQDRILAWCEFDGHLRGDGALWPTGEIVAIGEADGQAVTFHLHWPDLHFQRRMPLAPPLPVQLATPVAVAFSADLVRLDNPADHPPVPPVTVRRAVSVSPPLGALGVRTIR